MESVNSERDVRSICSQYIIEKMCDIRVSKCQNDCLGVNYSCKVVILKQWCVPALPRGLRIALVDAN